MTKMVDSEALSTSMTLQKTYIDTGDQANATLIAELQETTSTQADQISELQETVSTLETGSNFYVACYEKGSTDNVPLSTQGNIELTKNFDFYLLDTTDNANETTTPVGKLQKNNLFHFENGNYAPVVGITEDQYNECMANAVYTLDSDGSYNLLYESGAFDAEAQWETDKALIQEGSDATTLYKLVEGAYTEVEHVLRPWETTETKYTIGLAAGQDLYLLDNVEGTSGKYWKGIFTEAQYWDGIDLSKYKLPRTAIGPGPMTTIVDTDGLTKCRNFFYLYQAANSYCRSSAGYLEDNPFYDSARHYPRVGDVRYLTNMNYARNNNADTTKSYPFAEGGWWATNGYILAQELLAGTRYLHSSNLFGSGISSDDGCNSSNFYTSGGVRLRVSGDEDWTYRTFGDNSAPYYYYRDDGNGEESYLTTNMSNLLTSYRPIEASMESQLAASMATELGIAPTDSADNLNTFSFYGGTYYYMDVPGFSGLQDGDMNARVYRVQTSEVSGYTSTGVATTFDFEIVSRMSLFGGANLSGDIWSYNGGGLELVLTRESDDTVGLTLDVYLQPDQTQWHSETSETKAVGSTWDFESSYMKVGSTETLGNSYTLERMSNSPVKIQKANSLSQGECYYHYDNLSSGVSNGYRGRMRSLFRGRAYNSSCSPRALYSDTLVSYTYSNFGGSFQALIEPQA